MICMKLLIRPGRVWKLFNLDQDESGNFFSRAEKFRHSVITFSKERYSINHSL